MPTAPTSAAPHAARAPKVTPTRLPAWGVALGIAAVAGAAVVGLAVGPARIPLPGAALEVLDHLPGVELSSGLSEREAAIVWAIRLPRVVLGLLVGAMLAIAGASYQGAFRNPLADPYLLGVAAGAGLGATLAIAAGAGTAQGMLDPVPAAAFAGALGAVALTYALGGQRSRRSTATLILAGVAVASFCTAIQTFVQQRNDDTIRRVYAWILGRLSTAGWSEVALVLPYVVVCSAVLLLHRRVLDVLAVGDDEAASLGLPVRRARIAIVVAASLGTAAAVAVSGLIAFVGIIVPHAIRLVAGSSYRVILPLSVFFGAAFLSLADLAARTALAPSELPIGVVTAFIGAPFFFVVLRTSAREVA